MNTCSCGWVLLSSMLKIATPLVTNATVVPPVPV
jgi:hypothetical protein